MRSCPLIRLSWGGRFEFTAGLLSNPVKLAEAQMKLWQDYAGIWQNLTRRALGEEVPPYVQPAPGDRQFKDDAWTNELVYDFLKQSYLVGSRWIQGLVAETPGVNERTRAEIQFLTRQYIDAIAPTNFVLTNPVVARKTMETGGANLLAGMSNFLDDLTRNNALVKNRAPETFKVGVNIAATPGSVIYQNDLMQLIQYNPSTKDVSKTPILFVPPWVNKYYLFDLQPKNSFLKWLVDQGHTVFAISWVNPGKQHRDKDFVDYMKEGPLAALDAIEQATGEREAHVVAYCLGGTLTATMLAWQAARNDTRVKSATLLATLTEFSDLGEFSVFFDEDRLLKLDRYLEKKGFLEGHDLARLFSIVRANDLIWSAVVNNYLLAEESLPFDMTYWFADPAHMPAKMLNFYIRNIVLRTVCRNRANWSLTACRSISARSRRRHASCRCTTITWRPGVRPTRVRICSAGRPGSSSAGPDIMRASSTLRSRRNMATGPIRNCRRRPMTGWPVPRGMRGHGGLNGRHGLPLPMTARYRPGWSAPGP